jgi:hypothetical protein
VSELTKEEQANVRAAMRFLRFRCGGWIQLAKALHIGRTTAKRANSAMVAYRVARLAGVGVDDVLVGAFPPAGTCPHCGHAAAEAANAGPRPISDEKGSQWLRSVSNFLVAAPRRVSIVLFTSTPFPAERLGRGYYFCAPQVASPMEWRTSLTQSA